MMLKWRGDAMKGEVCNCFGCITRVSRTNAARPDVIVNRGRVVVGSGRSMQAGSSPVYAKGIGAKDGVRLPGGHSLMHFRRGRRTRRCVGGAGRLRDKLPSSVSLQLPSARPKEAIAVSAFRDASASEPVSRILS
jgi:hypothetical protein